MMYRFTRTSQVGFLFEATLHCSCKVPRIADFEFCFVAKNVIKKRKKSWFSFVNW